MASPNIGPDFGRDYSLLSQAELERRVQLRRTELRVLIVKLETLTKFPATVLSPHGVELLCRNQEYVQNEITGLLEELVRRNKIRDAQRQKRKTVTSIDSGHTESE